MRLVVKYCVLIAVISIGCKKSKHAGGPDQPEKKAIVTTIAGDGTDAFENGPALSAKFRYPVDVAVAPDGTMYVADYTDHRVRKLANGQVTTLAGDGTFGFANGDGPAAKFMDPYRLAVDQAGDVYLIDQVDARIRKITPGGYVSTYAGMEAAGFLDGPSLTAKFLVNAGGLDADAAGNIYEGDSFNHRIRKAGVDGQVRTVAGNGNRGLKNGDGATAEFRFPGGVACDRQGNIYISDQRNFCIRKIAANGEVSTLAGTGVNEIVDGGPGVAEFRQPGDLVADSQGNIYVIDGARIRKVTPQGVVSTVAGSTEGYADGEGPQAKFRGPGGLGIDAQDNVYVADYGDHRIRKISFL
jgi:sugar lactone lactonase YvrE